MAGLTTRPDIVEVWRATEYLEDEVPNEQKVKAKIYKKKKWIKLYQ